MKHTYQPPQAVDIFRHISHVERRARVLYLVRQAGDGLEQSDVPMAVVPLKEDKINDDVCRLPREVHISWVDVDDENAVDVEAEGHVHIEYKLSVEGLPINCDSCVKRRVRADERIGHKVLSGTFEVRSIDTDCEVGVGNRIVLKIRRSSSTVPVAGVEARGCSKQGCSEQHSL